MTNPNTVTKFLAHWTGRGYERGDTQKFWLELLRDVLGIADAVSYIKFEAPVQLKHQSFIDAFIPDTKVLIEQKSFGKDLNQPIIQSDGSKLTPYQQAKRYGNELPYSLRPRWIVACNFREFLIYDMEKLDAPTKILLEELPEKIHLLDFLVDKTKTIIRDDEALSVKAGDLVDKLYEALKKNYLDPDSDETLQSLNKLCVRLVFCLYAESAGVFGKRKIFTSYLESENDLRRGLIDLFRILNTPPAQRDPYDDRLNQFPYVNGGLFADNRVEIPKITPATRDILFNEVCPFKWQDINPTIFGAVFESTINAKLRRTGGMHYTSRTNIRKVIDPLFMDDLREEFASIDDDDKKALRQFQDKLASIKIFDPACGSGNFLTESFLSLRRLENELLKKLLGAQITIGTMYNPVKVSINQFYGIEIDNFAAAVARTALWISELQMLKETSEIVHMPLEALPLKSYPNIHEANALRTDWRKIISPNDCTFIISNPPFVGASNMSAEQKAEAVNIFGKIKLSNSIDYVGAWYHLAAKFIQGTNIRAAFVSTNSITQGEQVAPLWKNLNAHIDFAYRTFKWDSESEKKAHVHVVIISFSASPNPKPKIIFDADGSAHTAQNINAYLVDAPNVFVESRGKPICNVPKMTQGNMPIDDGNFIFSEEEAAAFIEKYPSQKHLLRRYMGAKDFLHGKPIRYCLWLLDVPPNEFINNREIRRRLEAVREFRLKSTAEPTRQSADTPYKFFSTPQGNGKFILIPQVTSERRKYIPIGFFDSQTIVSNLVSIVSGATLYHFGVLTSSVHMAWLKTVGGRLEMRYRYSGNVVYNNFPWAAATVAQERAIEATAQKILDVRAKYPQATLADLYDALAMPADLRRAHEENDAAVLAAYGFGAGMTEAEIVAALMRLYQKLKE